MCAFSCIFVVYILLLMNNYIVLITIGVYLLLLFLISRFTSKRTDNSTFFTGNRQSPWYIVAIGMVGASISGVTFVSVPGWVNATGFTYMQMVAGFFAGYIVIANILLPLYYRLNLISIYSYLGGRFGVYSHKTGSFIFIASRLAGSSARLYLMVSVLQYVIFDGLNVPFFVTTSLTLLVIWLYTHKSGIRTIIFTDTLQTIIFILCVAITYAVISSKMNLSFTDSVSMIYNSDFFKVFEWSDWRSTSFFWKQFISGAFITVVMTGLDQDMMQKNLSCRSLKEARKNMYWYGFAFIPVNLMFLGLGALLYLYAASSGLELPAKSDDMFPFIADSGVLPPVVTVLFIFGLLAAALSSADSTLTSLTTSYAVDIVEVEKKDSADAVKIRKRIHVVFTVLTGLIIMVFYSLQQDTIISAIYTIAGYTYGPLLGLFALGLFTKIRIDDASVPYAAIVAPLFTGLIHHFDVQILGFKLGYEALLINAIITVVVMFLITFMVKSRKIG